MFAFFKLPPALFISGKKCLVLYCNIHPLHIVLHIFIIISYIYYARLLRQSLPVSLDIFVIIGRSYKLPSGDSEDHCNIFSVYISVD